MHRSSFFLTCLFVCHAVLAADPAAPPAADAAAKAKYTELVEKVEGDGKSCMVSGSPELFQEQKDAVEAFLSTLQYLEFAPDKPVKLRVPDDFYNPQGQTVTIKSYEVFVSRSRPEKPYLVVSRIPGALQIVARFSLTMGDKLICVGDATLRKPYNVDGKNTQTLQQLDAQRVFADWQVDPALARSSRGVYHRTLSKLIELGSVKPEADYLSILSGYVTDFNALNEGHPFEAAQRADICTALEGILEVLALPHYKKCADLPGKLGW
jgi:hypothetical protein